VESLCRRNCEEDRMYPDNAYMISFVDFRVRTPLSNSTRYS
jgi:hypothetical protein